MESTAQLVKSEIPVSSHERQTLKTAIEKALVITISQEYLSFSLINICQIIGLVYLPNIQPYFSR